MNEQHQQENHSISPLAPAVLPALAQIIGREEEIRVGLQLLAQPEVRLLTLTGVGGVGKTRLAQALVEQAGPAFADGSISISLAALNQPALLLPTLLQGTGLREEQGQSPLETLVAFLRARQTLLFLDNFEQIIAGATLLVGLLARCPHLKLLVTSRERLRVSGEQLFQLHPLPLPDRASSTQEKALAANAAIRLFLQRLQTIQPALPVDAETLRAIAEICIRLDGLPLAIELAAVRCNLFSPRALLTRLERRLPLLTHGSRDLPSRQQTLRNTLAWSYELLSDKEQHLFRRLAIFAGGCTIAAAEALSADPNAFLDALTSLFEKSLLQRVESRSDEPRLRMLETLREYGLERLHERGEYNEIRELHASYYLRLAEHLGPELNGPDASRWLSCLEPELDNLRGALQWWHEQRTEVNVLRLAGALASFWIMSGHGREGYQWLTQALDSNPQSSTIVQARARLAIGMLAPYNAHYAQWQTCCQESLQLFEELHDRRGMAEALNELGCAVCWQGQLTEAYQFHTRSLALWQGCGDQLAIASTKLHLARVLYAQSRYQEARALAQESLRLFNKLAYRRGIAQTLRLLAFLASYYQEHQRSLRLAEESLRLLQDLGEQWEIAAQLHAVAELARRQNENARALACAQESLEIARRVGNREALARGLHLLAQLHRNIERQDERKRLLDESLVLYEELGNQEGIATVLLTQAQLAYMEKAYADARRLLERCLQILVSKENKPALIASLAELAHLAAREGQASWTIRLLAASDALREAIGRPPVPLKDAYLRLTTLVAVPPSEREFTVVWQAGRSLTPAQAVAAREESAAKEPSSPGDISPPPLPTRLTAREREVLRLLTLGLTNPQIARRLVISPVTVNAHVRSIYGKLAVTSRSAATRYALLHQLV